MRTLIAAAVLALSVNVYASEPTTGAAPAGGEAHAAAHEDKKPMSKEECKAKGLKGKKLKECMAGK